MIKGYAARQFIMRLWDDALDKPRLGANERLELHVETDSLEDAWNLDVYRFLVDDRGSPRLNGYRGARTQVDARELTSRSFGSKGAFIDWLLDKMNRLVERVLDRLPEGWRLFGRRPGRKLHRTRLHWRFS